MTNKIPIKLRKEPLVEAVFEIRFASNKKSISEILPGLLYKDLKDQYPEIISLPLAEFPAMIIDHAPKLKYAPKIRLEGKNQAIQIGEHVASLSCRRPYTGWETFSNDIRLLINKIRGTGLVEFIERFSLKYINLIELDQVPDLNCLNLEMKLGRHEINTKPVQIRTEIKENNLIHIVQIVSPAEASIPGDPHKLRGVLVDIDTIRAIKETETWSDIDGHLDEVHLSSKGMFFDLLKPETIERLDPVYGE